LIAYSACKHLPDNFPFMSGSPPTRHFLSCYIPAAFSWFQFDHLYMPRFTKDPLLLENRILAALPRQEQERLLPHLEQVRLETGQQLYESGEPIRYAYFPESALIALLSVTEDGATVEVGLVGNEGMLGIPILLQSETLPYRTIVQSPGSAQRMRAGFLQKEFNLCGPFHDRLLRYLHVLITQLAQAGVCNRFHTIEQRLCRWLLAAQDRIKSTELKFTQESLSQMLGTDRTSVTETASTLQKAGLIRYSRGHITILDREGLGAAACECHAIIKKEFDRLFRA
jgi:CRP-like cAMP-binding protein